MSIYDWTTIQQYYDQGRSFRDITKEFGAANKTITNAVKRGDLISRSKNYKRLSSHARCRECGSDIPITRSKYCSHECMNSARYKYVKQWRQTTKLKLVSGFGGMCGICKLEDHPCVYDLHHLDGSKKDFTLSQKIRSWSALISEAKKCVLLCAPCHRKHHAGLLEIPIDIPRFDERLVVPHGIEP